MHVYERTAIWALIIFIILYMACTRTSSGYTVEEILFPNRNKGILQVSEKAIASSMSFFDLAEFSQLPGNVRQEVKTLVNQVIGALEQKFTQEWNQGSDDQHKQVFNYLQKTGNDIMFRINATSNFQNAMETALGRPLTTPPPGSSPLFDSIK